MTLDSPATLGAARLGRDAFHAGLDRIPTLDFTFNKMLLDHLGLNFAAESATDLLKAWLFGWDSENLKG
jgi:hypothetical protein